MTQQHNWDQIRELVGELAGQCSCRRELREKVSEAIGYRLPRQTFNDWLVRESGLLFDGYAQLKSWVAGYTEPGWHTEDERQNVVTRSYTAEEKMAYDEFIAELDPDLETWTVKSWEASKFTAWRKNEDKDLTFNNGVIDGHVRSGGILSKEFWNVKASFVRKELQVNYPQIQPVTFSGFELSKEMPRLPTSVLESMRPEGFSRALIVSDAQIGFFKDPKNALLTPFHCRESLDIVCQTVASQWFDYVIIAGDWTDFTEWTKHYAQEPEFHLTTQPTVYESAWWIARIKAMSLNPDVKIIFIEGNHEQRMYRFQRDYAYFTCDLRPADDVMLPLLSVERMLGLPGLGVEYMSGYPDSCYWLTDDIKVIHGDLTRKGGVAKTYLDGSRVSVLFGHTHRKEELWDLGESMDEPVVGASFGWLGKRCPGATDRRDWHKGFGIAEFKETGPPSLQQIHINDMNQAIVGGKLLTGVSRVDEIAAAFPDWHWR